ncbi:MAG: C39 family peptidase [Eubacteriales bacterium]|nr:C39 family peptidase [Eubacteriales bacterium]
MYNVRKTLLVCVAVFTAVVLTVSVMLYTLAFAPFGILPDREKISKTENLQTEIFRISQIDAMEGIELATAFDYGEDTPADSLTNSIKAFPSQSESLQMAEYAAFMSIKDKTNSNDDTFIYYCQAWEEYASIPYGNETIGTYGCGPTNVAMIVSTLTGRNITPDEVASLAVKWGCFVSGTGTSHSIFGKSAAYYGLNVEEFTATRNLITTKLKAGQLIVCSMGNGYFSRLGHFITLRGITDDGKILIADSYSQENTEKEWDLDFLISQLRYTHMWAFGE